MISFETIKALPNYHDGIFTLCDQLELIGYQEFRILIDHSLLIDKDQFFKLSEGQISYNQEIIDISEELNIALYYLYGPYYQFSGYLNQNQELVFRLPLIKNLVNNNIYDLSDPWYIIEQIHNLFYQSYPQIKSYDFGLEDIYALSGLFDNQEIDPDQEQIDLFLENALKLYMLEPSKYRLEYQIDDFDQEYLTKFYKDHKNSL